jgi:hypothetical protein
MIEKKLFNKTSVVLTKKTIYFSFYRVFIVYLFWEELMKNYQIIIVIWNN